VFILMMGFAFGQGLSLPNPIAHGIIVASIHRRGVQPVWIFATGIGRDRGTGHELCPGAGWQPALWFSPLAPVIFAGVAAWKRYSPLRTYAAVLPRTPGV
jgi:hypothetical protein